MNRKNRMFRNLAMVLGVLAVSAVPALAAADADVSAGVADSLLTWAIIQDALISIGVFLIAWRLFKRLKAA